MFKFLREKLKQGIAALTKKIDEEAKEEVVEVPVSPKAAAEPSAALPKEEKRGFFSKLFRKKEEPEVEVQKPAPEAVEPVIEEKPAKEEIEPLAKSPEPAAPESHREEIASFSEDKDLNELPAREEPAGKEAPDIAKMIEEAPEIGEEPPIILPEKAPIKEIPTPKKEGKISAPAEKKGFFAALTEKIVTKKISAEKFDELFWELEVGLLENNVAMGVIEKLKDDLKKMLVDVPIHRGKVEETIEQALSKGVSDVLNVPPIDLLDAMGRKKPFIICFVGINGSGKTTSIAKITKYLLDNKKKVVLAAADTFRAAAIDQLQIHADNLGVKMIRQEYGSDPAAVAFDAIKYAEAKDMDAVLIDTAGRLHSNTNLVDEMKKIVRVAKPDLKIFVGEAITGNDCIEQAEQFNEAIGIDGIILAKADIDEKGGAALSVSYVTQKPILFLGTGQEYKDLKPFSKEEFMQSLGLET